MRRPTPLTLLVLVALLLGLVPSTKANIYGKDPSQPTAAALAKDLAYIAATFGCAEFAWGKMTTPTDATLEFVPSGDDVRSWTRLVTINTITLPPEEAKQRAELKKLEVLSEKFFREKGQVIETEAGIDAQGLATRFVEYEVGKGDAKEHNAAAVFRLRSGLAGIVQIQSRGKPLSRDDAAKMKAFAVANKQATTAPAATFAIDKHVALFEEVCVANIADLAAARRRATTEKWTSLDAAALKTRVSQMGKPFTEGWQFEREGEHYDVRLLIDTTSVAPPGEAKSFSRSACNFKVEADATGNALSHLRSKYGKEGVNLKSEGEQMAAFLYWQSKGAGDTKPAPWVFLTVPKPGEAASTILEVSLVTETRTE